MITYQSQLLTVGQTRWSDLSPAEQAAVEKQRIEQVVRRNTLWRKPAPLPNTEARKQFFRELQIPDPITSKPEANLYEYLLAEVQRRNVGNLINLPGLCWIIPSGNIEAYEPAGFYVNGVLEAVKQKVLENPDAWIQLLLRQRQFEPTLSSSLNTIQRFDQNIQQTGIPQYISQIQFPKFKGVLGRGSAYPGDPANLIRRWVWGDLQRVYEAPYPLCITEGNVKWQANVVPGALWPIAVEHWYQQYIQAASADAKAQEAYWRAVESGKSYKEAQRVEQLTLEKEGTAAAQQALAKRKEEREFFQYNPTFPERAEDLPNWLAREARRYELAPWQLPGLEPLKPNFPQGMSQEQIFDYWKKRPDDFFHLLNIFNRHLGSRPLLPANNPLSFFVSSRWYALKEDPQMLLRTGHDALCGLWNDPTFCKDIVRLTQTNPEQVFKWALTPLPTLPLETGLAQLPVAGLHISTIGQTQNMTIPSNVSYWAELYYLQAKEHDSITDALKKGMGQADAARAGTIARKQASAEIKPLAEEYLQIVTRESIDRATKRTEELEKKHAPKCSVVPTWVPYHETICETLPFVYAGAIVTLGGMMWPAWSFNSWIFKWAAVTTIATGVYLYTKP